MFWLSSKKNKFITITNLVIFRMQNVMICSQTWSLIMLPWALLGVTFFIATSAWSEAVFWFPFLTFPFRPWNFKISAWKPICECFNGAKIELIESDKCWCFCCFYRIHVWYNNCLTIHAGKYTIQESYGVGWVSVFQKRGLQHLSERRCDSHMTADCICRAM